MSLLRDDIRAYVAHRIGSSASTGKRPRHPGTKPRGDAFSYSFPDESLARADAAIASLAPCGAYAIRQSDESYPKALLPSADPPPWLFVRGTLAPSDDPAVAIVGSRAATTEGRRIARALGRGLAELGITIVSGLARGIDAEAHRGALEGGGRTLAVLGCGIDRVYPPEHASLANEIIAQGALLSELPPGVPPARHHFPMRNRILAALARAVIVVEAAERSGSLITARLAVEEGRSVLAVPGSPLSTLHGGTNRLIQEGARLLQDLRDVLEELPDPARWKVLPGAPGTPSTIPLAQTNPIHLRLLTALSTRDPRALEALIDETGFSLSVAAGALIELEMDGQIARLPGARYLRLADTSKLTAATVVTSLPAPTVLSSEKPAPPGAH